MQYQEQKIPYSEADLTKLKGNRKMLLIVGGLITLVFTAIPVGIIVSSGGGMAWVALLFPCIAVGALGYVFYRQHLDLTEGIKIRIRGEITDKSEKTTRSSSTRTSGSSTKTTYYLTIGKRKLTVEYDNYQQFRVGEFVQIEIAPYTETILEAKSLDENPTASAEDIAKANRPILERLGDLGITKERDTKIMNRQLVNFTDDEQRAIKAARTSNIWSFLGILTGILFFGAFLSLFIIAFFVIFLIKVVPKEYSQIVTIAFVFGLPSIALYYLVSWFVSRVRPFNRDLANRQKEVVTTNIADKFKSNVQHTSGGWRVTSSRSSGSDYYYIRTLGTTYCVSPEQYEAVDLDTPVKLHFAPLSRVLLKIEFLKNERNNF